MILAINHKQAGLKEGVSRRIKRLLHFSLSRFSGVVTRVKVRCYDVNGPKGGVDKRCHIVAKLKATGQVMVEGKGTGYIEALNNCLDRLVRATRREIDKRQSKPIRKNRREAKLSLAQDEGTLLTKNSPTRIDEQAVSSEGMLFKSEAGKRVIKNPFPPDLLADKI